MAGINFKDLKLETNIDFSNIKFGDIELNIRNYLTTREKAKLIQFVVEGALDDNTGCFSPLRVDVYFSIAICGWYAGIIFDEEDAKNIESVYDALDSNGVLQCIINAIPSEEFNFIQDLVNNTIEDIAKYNSSAAGIIKNMTVDADGLGSQIENILEKVKNGEGLETLSVIKDMV